MKKKFTVGIVPLSISIACYFLNFLKIQVPFDWIISPISLLVGFILILIEFKKISEKQEQQLAIDKLKNFEREYGKLSCDTTIKGAGIKAPLPKISEPGYIEISPN